MAAQTVFVSTHKRVVYFLISFFLLSLIFWSSLAFGYYDSIDVYTDAYTVSELKTVIDGYENQVKVFDSQIKAVKKDLNWLILKINRISDSGREVSQVLHRSVDKKVQKIRVLKKEKSLVTNQLDALRKIYSAKKPKYQDVPDASRPEIKSENIQLAMITQEAVSKGKRSKIESEVQKAGLDDWVEVLAVDDGCAKLENTLPILFSSGSAVIAKEYKPFLEKLAQFLKSYDVKIFISGFADPDPIHTKKYPSNFELGASRAASVVHELVRYGLKPSIFNIGSTGEHRFAAKNPSKQKSFQRRVHLTVVFSG